MFELFQYDFAIKALIGSIIIGTLSPAIGVFLVQRRLALLGDGIGHISLTGVGLALLFSFSPFFLATLFAAIGAITIEALRLYSKTSADMGLALVFYGGIAMGVMLTYLSPQGNAATLHAFLFGSLTTINDNELITLIIYATLILLILVFIGRAIFVAGIDSNVAKVQGLKVGTLNIFLAALAAVSIIISMKIVGLLMASAIMIIPVASAQIWSNSFKWTFIFAIGIGLTSSLSGLFLSFQYDIPSGPTIVLVALSFFIVTIIGKGIASIKESILYKKINDFLHIHHKEFNSTQHRDENKKRSE